MRNTYNVTAGILLLVAVLLDRDTAAAFLRFCLIIAAAVCGYKGWKANRGTSIQ